MLLLAPAGAWPVGLCLDPRGQCIKTLHSHGYVGLSIVTLRWCDQHRVLPNRGFTRVHEGRHAVPTIWPGESKSKSGRGHVRSGVVSRLGVERAGTCEYAPESRLHGKSGHPAWPRFRGVRVRRCLVDT